MGSPFSPTTRAVLSDLAALRGAPAPVQPFAENFLSVRSSAAARLSIGALGTPLTPPAAAPSPAGIKPPTPLFLSQLAADLAASDALFMQRKYSDAFLRATPDGPFSLAGYSHAYEAIRLWIAGGGDFTQELADDAKHAGLSGADCLHLLELYLPAAQSYALVTLGNPIPTTLNDTEIAYIWLQWATVALDWGNALFRNSDQSNNDLAVALTIYRSVVAVDLDSSASVPLAGTSPLYDIPMLTPAADKARKIIQNFSALLQGTTTAQALQVNPTQAGVIVEVYQQIVKIQNGLDFWGHWRNTVPIWTFEYLQSVATNFAQLAISAERDFINFQDRNDQAQFTRQQLVQTASQANAEVDAASAQVDAAAAELSAYAAAQTLANARAADATANASSYASSSDLAIQYDAVRTQIAGGDSGDFDQVNGLANQLMAGGTITWSGSTSDLFNNSTGAATAANQLVSARLSRQYEVDSLNRTATEMGLAADQAKQEVAAAGAKVNAAVAAETVARLHAEGAQQSLQAFDSQTFTPDIWQRMADTMWRLYRRYLGMALNTALLMQRAYNFETDQALGFIKSDYSVDEVKGLLGADALLADIETFTYDLITSRAGKPQPLRQTISLAQNYAFAFERQFRKMGIMEFETRIDDFDYIYPGTYAGRIENVEVEVVGIVPISGLSGTLTNSGISGYRLPSSAAAPGTSGLKYRLQSKETLVLSDYTTRNDVLLLPADSKMTRIFQGAGLASTWRLELPRAVNDIDFGTVLDVRLTFYYQARYDPDLHDSVLTELALRPGINSRQRAIQLRWIYPDSFFVFQDTGELKCSLKTNDFRFNESDPVLTSLGAVVVTDGTIAPSGLKISLRTPGQPPQTAVTDAGGSIDSGTNAPAWQKLAVGTAIGDYVLGMTAADNPALLDANGALNLSPIVNIALIIGYSFTPRT